MNINKIIFYQNKKTFQINKSFYFKYTTKYLGKNIISYVRFKRFYSNWELKLKKGLKPDYMNNKTVYDLLTRNNSDFSYECFDHKGILIEKDFNFYNYIVKKDFKYRGINMNNELINELSNELINQFSMELML